MPVPGAVVLYTSPGFGIPQEVKGRSLGVAQPGLRATVRVDAFTERTYDGTVKTVAVLPDQGGWFGSDTKVYKTIVTLDSPPAELRVGMTVDVTFRASQ